VWYLVARAGGEVRSYRVSRVASARLTDEPAERPEGFDLAAFWANSLARFREELPRFHATFRAHESVLHLLRYAGRFSRLEEASEPDAGGWATVRMRFQFEEDACGLALSFGTRVEAVEPRGLREKILKMAEEVVAFYGEG
jgi:predicted DNA-binding transcriptional regulator YafY